MKLSILQKPTQKQNYILSQKASLDLKILSVDTESLIKLVQEEYNSNPFLDYDISYETGFSQKYVEKSPYDTVLDTYKISDSLYDQIKKQLIYLPDYIDKSFVCDLSLLLNNDGYLYYSSEQLKNMFPNKSLKEINLTIKSCQSLDPCGIFSQSLQECLILQIVNSNNSLVDICTEILKHHFDLLIKKDFLNLAKQMNLSHEIIFECINFITNLNPRPASSFFPSSAFIYPDIIIEYKDGEIIVDFRHKNYGLKIKDIPSSYFEGNKILENKCKKQAINLIDAIGKRNDTLARIIFYIINHQNDFFLNNGFLNPLNMSDLAYDLNLNISTISRAISNKYVQINSNVFPMKFFFPSSINNISSHELKEYILKIIENEDKKYPLSDQKIYDYLVEHDISIKRRTVTKYRNELGIPTSSLRRKAFIP